MSKPSNVLALLGRGGLSIALAASMTVFGTAAAFADDSTAASDCYWTTPSSAVTADSSLLTTYGVRAGSAGGDFLGISNTNFDFNKGTNSTGATGYDTISNLTDTSTATTYLNTAYGSGLAIWATSLNENPNPYYVNLYYTIVTGTYSTAGAASLSAATTWMANPESSSWGDSDGSTSYTADGTATIAGLEYSPDIIWGANKTTAWNLESDGSNSSTNIYTAESADSSYNPTYVTNDATNLWTQIYTMGQLATTADELTSSTGKATRYNDSDATESAVAYEKATRGQLLYIASLIDAGTIEKKTIAYLYAIDSDGVAYFFVPEASGLLTGDDTGGEDISVTHKDDSSYADTGERYTAASGADDNYASNNSTINMGYMATLPFISDTFDSGTALENGITMKVEDIYKQNPVCTVSSASSSTIMADVDVVIFNSSTASSLLGTSGGKNSSGITNASPLTVDSVTTFCQTYGLSSSASVIAGDDYGTSTNQGVGDSSYTTTNGTAPLLYCQRNYTSDKDTRAAWGFAAVYPEVYGGNNDATYGYWVDEVYHVNTSDVASVVKYMTNQSDTVTYNASVADMVEQYALEGYAWWITTGVNDSDWNGYAYYNGSSRASWYGGGTAAEEPTDTIGIFAPSTVWSAAVSASTSASAYVSAYAALIEAESSLSTTTAELTQAQQDLSDAQAALTKASSKKTQTLSVTAKTKSVKAKAAKKKAQKVKKAITVKGSKGTVTYSKVSGNKKLSISKKGVITVKKGTKKGTYKIKVKVKAAGNSKYNAAATTITVKVKVK